MLLWELPEDPDKWNAKIVNKTTNHAHIEMRTTKDGQDILLCVSNIGNMKLQFGSKAQETCNIRLSSKLPIKFTFNEWKKVIRAVKEARRKLKEYEQTYIAQG